MKKNVTRVLSAVMYVVGAVFTVLYILLSLNNDLIIHPVVRLLILAVMCISVYAGSIVICKTFEQARREKIMKSTFMFFFVLYIVVLLTFTMFDSFYGRHGYNRFFVWDSEMFYRYINESLNLIPFKTIFIFIKGFFDGSIRKDVAAVNLLGNLIAFSPFAFFMPLLFKKMKSLKRFTIAMLIIVAAVECTQLIMLTGSFDVDDLILNVGGAVIFYKLFHIQSVKKVISSVTKLEF